MRTIAMLCACLLAQRALADLAPVGPEFQVNTYTTADQLLPRVGADADGNFVVVWDSGSYYRDGPDGSRTGISARRFDSAGSPQGSEFLVNTYTVGPQDSPDVAVTPAGDFLVAWQGGDYYFYQDGSLSGAFVQRFTAGGAPLGGEQRANTTTAGSQEDPAVAVGPAGDAVVVWESFAGDGDGAGVFAQRYDPAGTPVGPEFQVNTYTTAQQRAPAVAVDSAGAFVVVWQSGSNYDYPTDQDGSGRGVFAQRFDAAGARVGGEFQVNTYTTGPQVSPAVAVGPGGGFVVVWQSGNYSGGQDGDRAGVFAQRFEASGLRAGSEFQVNTYTTGFQDEPDVAIDAGGNFVVTWRSTYGQDGSGAGIFGQHFASTSEAVGPEFRINTHTDGDQQRPSVTAVPPADFIVVWDSRGYPGQDGDGTGVFGQRLRTSGFAPPRPVSGNKLVLRDDPTNPRRRRLSLRSDDENVALGMGEGSRDDPTRSGGSLRVRSATFDVTYPLPGSFWRRIASGGTIVGWSYRDSALLGGPISKVVLRRGRLRVDGKGAGLQHDLGVNPDPVEVTLQIGASGLRQCMRLGGATAFKPARRFRAEGAAAPPSCGS